MKLTEVKRVGVKVKKNAEIVSARVVFLILNSVILYMIK